MKKKIDLTSKCYFAYKEELYTQIPQVKQHIGKVGNKPQ